MLNQVMLNDNEITSIADGSFSEIINLERLVLNNNELVAAKTYKSKTIDLSSNNLKSIYISTKTEEIKMEDNFIETINCTKETMSVIKLLVIIIIQSIQI